jgi:hypothetical protein
MERQLSDKLKIVEAGDNAAIVYQHPDGSKKNIFFDKGGVYANSTLALDATNTIEMPLAYSSAFQTATLASYLLPLGNSTQWATSVLSTKFLTTAAVSNVNTGNIGLGSTAVTGASATINSTGFMLNIGSMAFANLSGFSFTSSVDGIYTTIGLSTE